MQCEHIGPLVKKGNLSPWQAMCLHLLFERASGEASFWYPYIALLPTDLELVGTHPMLWPEVRASLHLLPESGHTAVLDKSHWTRYLEARTSSIKNNLQVITSDEVGTSFR